MVAVATVFRPQILFMPIVPQLVVCVGGFTQRPTVEGFIHNQHSEAVAHIQQFGRGRIMASANGIAAHPLQEFHLPLQSPGVDCRAQRAQIMVIADALQRHAFAVQKKTIIRRELNRADAKWGFVIIHDFPILLNRSHHHVALRMLNAPQLRIWQQQLTFVWRCLMGREIQSGNGLRRDQWPPLPIRIKCVDFVVQGHNGIGFRIIFHVDLNFYRR